MEGEKSLGLIPQVFYDLISRIPVGILLLLTANWMLQRSFDSEPWAGPQDKLNLSSLLILLVISYVIGLLFTAGSYPLFKIIDGILAPWIRSQLRRLNEELNGKLAEALGIDPQELFKPSRLSRVRRRIYFVVLGGDRFLGAELAKHQAEAALFCNLYAGFLTVFWLAYLPAGQVELITGDIHHAAPIVLALLLLLTLGGAIYRERVAWRYHLEFLRTCLRPK